MPQEDEAEPVGLQLYSNIPVGAGAAGVAEARAAGGAVQASDLMCVLAAAEPFLDAASAAQHKLNTSNTGAVTTVASAGGGQHLVIEPLEAMHRALRSAAAAVQLVTGKVSKG